SAVLIGRATYFGSTPSNTVLNTCEALAKPGVLRPNTCPRTARKIEFGIGGPGRHAARTTAPAGPASSAPAASVTPPAAALTRNDRRSSWSIALPLRRPFDRFVLEDRPRRAGGIDLARDDPVEQL